MFNGGAYLLQKGPRCELLVDLTCVLQLLPPAVRSDDRSDGWLSRTGPTRGHHTPHIVLRGFSSHILQGLSHAVAHGARRLPNEWHISAMPPAICPRN